MNYWKPYVNIRKRKMWIIIIHGAKEHRAQVLSVCVCTWIVAEYDLGILEFLGGGLLY